MKESLPTIVAAQTVLPVMASVRGFIAAHPIGTALCALAVGLLLVLLFRRILSSLRMAQIIMMLLVPLLALSVLLPQNGEYEGLGRVVGSGWLVGAAQRLGLMNVFTSPLFCGLLALLALSALVCSLRTIGGLRRRRGRPALRREEVLAGCGAVTMAVSGAFGPDTLTAIHKALRAGGLRGRRIRKCQSPPAAAVLEMGSGTLWPAVLYHLGLVLLLAGCLVTLLFGFSGHTVVYTNRPTTVPLGPHSVRWHRLHEQVQTQWHRLFGGGAPRTPRGDAGDAGAPETARTQGRPQPAPPEDTLWLGLRNLTVVYRQWPHLNYPVFAKGAGQDSRAALMVRRFMSAWGLRKHDLKGALTDSDPSVADFSAQIVSYMVPPSLAGQALGPETPVQKEGKAIALRDAQSHADTLRPNRPRQIEDVTLCILGPLFRVDMEVENAAPLLGLGCGQPFRVPGSQALFCVRSIAAGTLVTMDGRRSPLLPTVYVFPLLPSPQGAETPPLIALPVGEWRQVGSAKVRLTGVADGCVLAYRRDPGAPLWGTAVIVLLLALCVRVYWPHYRVKVFAEAAPTGGASLLHVAVDAHGVFSDPQRALDATRNALRAGGLLA